MNLTTKLVIVVRADLPAALAAGCGPQPADPPPQWPPRGAADGHATLGTEFRRLLPDPLLGARRSAGAEPPAAIGVGSPHGSQGPSIPA